MVSKALRLFCFLYRMTPDQPPNLSGIIPYKEGVTVYTISNRRTKAEKMRISTDLPLDSSMLQYNEYNHYGEGCRRAFAKMQTRFAESAF